MKTSNIVFRFTRRFATLIERGRAAEIREKYNVPRHIRLVLHDIVHEKHNKPTKFNIPEINRSWSINKKWNSYTDRSYSGTSSGTQ